MNSIINYVKNKERVLILILLNIILLFFIFSFSINALYYAFDSYRYALGGPEKLCSQDDGFYFVKTLGRPIQAYVDCLSFKFAYTLEKMRLLRCATIIIMGCVMGLFSEWLLCLGFSFWAAFFVSGSSFLLIQLYPPIITMATMPLPLSILLTIFAYFCINKSYNTKQPSTWIFLSFIFILCSALTYPAMTFFFPALILTKLLFTDLKIWSKTKLEASKEVLLFGLACSCYFVWAYLNMHYNSQAPVPSAYQLDHPNINPYEIFKRIVLILNLFSNFWTILPFGNLFIQGWLAIILLSAGSVAAICNFIRSNFFQNNKKLAFNSIIQCSIFTMLILLLSSSFLLVIPSFNFIYNESWLAFGSLISGVILISWSLYQISYFLLNENKNLIFSFFMGLFFLLEAYQANIFSMALTASLKQGFNTTSESISNYFKKNKDLNRIHFIVTKSIYPYDEFFIANASLVDILGRNKFSIVWCSLPRGVPGTENEHLTKTLECIKNLKGNDIGITYSLNNEPIKITKNTLVIKAHETNDQNYFHNYLKQNFNIDA